MSFTRRIALLLLSTVMAVGTLAAVAYAGQAAATQEAISSPEAETRTWPDAQPSSPGPIPVAVVLGQSGTIGADVLAPYEVFARSPAFSVYTVAESAEPAPIAAGPALLPVHTFDEVDAGVAPSPDLLVVPAVQDPTGEREATMRDWIARQHDRGAQIFGVCSGSRVLAAAGVLDGRRATSHWGAITALEISNPEVEWIRGQRYVQDGPVTTTAGVTSGIPGALKVVKDLVGPEEAERIGSAVNYPGWALEAPGFIPDHSHGVEDLSLGVALAFPWMKPTVGVGLTDGVGEIDAAAAFEVYAQSYTARPVAIAPGDTITTRHGLVLATTAIGDNPDIDRMVVPGATTAARVDPRLRRWADTQNVNIEPLRSTTGQTGFDAALEDLAAHTSKASALAVAKMIDYPAGHLDLTSTRPQWRPHAMLLTSLALATGIGLLPYAILKRLRRPRITPASG
jgi:putative intracellular protease/amidase